MKAQLRPTSCQPRGFTLVEVLVTISIIAVLAVLAFMGSSVFIKKAASAKDLANMRTIWNGVILYTGDNNDFLPGPLFGGQRAVYGEKTTGRLSYFIAPYMGYTNPKVGDFLEAMASTSWQKTEATRNAPCYFVELDVPITDGTTVKPWGDKNITPNSKPMQMPGVLSRIDSSRTLALTDVDQLHPGVSNASWKSEVPAGMSHGNYRLATYFDGHNGKVDVNNKPLYAAAGNPARFGGLASIIRASDLHRAMHVQDPTLIPVARGWFRTLQLGLLLSSIGWGISFFFTFTTWETATDQLLVMGAGRIEYQPLLDYWLRMASAAFGCIGIASALACVRPRSFQGMIFLLGPFHVFMGTVLTVSAVRNHLNTESHPTFVADITFCFVTAILILVPLVVTRFLRGGCQ